MYIYIYIYIYMVHESFTPPPPVYAPPPKAGHTQGIHNSWAIYIYIYIYIIYIYIYIYIYIIVIVIVITTYHAVYWSYRASRADRWFLPRSIPWVPGLPEVAHSMTEDPEDRGYRATRLWGQWQLQSVSISNGDGRWPVCSPGVRGQGIAAQQHRNKQKARAPLSVAKQQPRNKAARMRRSES